MNFSSRIRCRPRREVSPTSESGYAELETRRLLAGVTFDPSSGIVNIDGSESADVARAFHLNTLQISVVLEGIVTRTFTASSVQKIVFTARGGDDQFRNFSSIPSAAYGQKGNDILIGGEGRDTFSGGPGNDVIDGNGGDDLLQGNEGDDNIDGGAGNDFLTGFTGSDIIRGRNGNDSIFGFDGDDELFGGFGQDLIAGQNGDDRIFGEGGEDLLYGNDGADLIHGGNSHDTISGGNDDDELYGDDGVDLIIAGAGSDTAFGGNQNDTIYGDEGNDLLYGGDGNDTLAGGQGRDRLLGQGGSDVLLGQNDSDILNGGDGFDSLTGGPDNDDFYADPGEFTDRDESEDDDSENDDEYRKSGVLSSRLTISFAPDGTGILDQTSNFFSSFASLASGTQLEQVLIDSFRTWGVHGNLDVGLVADSGAPFGTPGLSVGDPRFGDVRIGAIPMASDLYAVAIGQGDLISGTWAGDILFNSNAQFESLSHFMSVVLHEVGHVLGFKHVRNIDSVMHRFSTRLTLSPFDIANFQSVYGIRRLDSNDLDDSHGNNELVNATHIELENDFAEPGYYPAIKFGDLHDAADQDWYRLEIPEDYTGPVTFDVITSGISTLAQGLGIFGDDGALIQYSESNSARGDVISSTVLSPGGNRFLYARVDGGTDDSVGGYALVARLDLRNQVPFGEIAAVARDQAFAGLAEHEIAEYFSDPGNYYFGEDDFGDDSFLNAFELDDEDGYAPRTVFLHRASLSSAADSDFYRFESIETGDSSALALNISVRAIQNGGMIPKVSVFDASQNPVVVETIINGRGQVVMQIPNVESEAEYYVQVSSDDFLAFRSGSYEISLQYTTQRVNAVAHASGFAGFNQKQYHSLHVAESQIMQFALEAAPASPLSNQLLWATIYDQSGNIVYQIASRLGERRTSAAVYLAPGSYTVEVETIRPALSGVDYKLLGINLGDGQGPTLSDPSDSPFGKTNTGAYQFPDGVVSDSTYVFVNGQASNLPPPPNDQPPTNFFNWYWGL